MTRHRPTLLLPVLLACLLAAAWLRLPALATAPPGPHYDEAANAILAGDIGLRGARPVFISSYTGKETLFFYLAGGMVRLIGESLLSLRLTSAFVGVLTVAAAYRLAADLTRRRALAVWAALFVATSFVHLVFSRLGFRAVTQPLLQALTVIALLRALRSDQARWFAATGVLAGLTAYTYLAARLFPLVLLAALLPWLAAPGARGRRLGRLGLTAAVGALVLAPQLAYFVAHPEAFWVRIQQVAPGAGAELTVSAAYLKSLAMLAWRGDPYIRFNIPDRPILGALTAAAALVGWLVLLWQQRRMAPWQRAGAWLLLVNPFVMLLPTALATTEIVPSNLRAIGLHPFLYLLPAWGADWAWRRLAQRWHVPRPTRAAALAGVLALTLVVAVWRVQRAYVGTWSADPALFYASDADLADVAAFIDGRAAVDETVFIAAEHYRHPTVAFLAQRYEQVRWLPQGRALALTPGAALYVYPRSSPPPPWVLPLLTDAAVLSGPPGPDGAPTFTAFALAAPPALPPGNRADNFGDVLRLEDVAAADGAVTLRWRVTGTPTGAFTPFIHVEDAGGVRWGQVETFSYPAEQWAVGDVIVQHEPLPTRAGRPPGAYRLIVGLFDPATQARLPRLRDGRFAGSTAVVEDVALPAAPLPEPLPGAPVPLNLTVTPGLTLLGYERGGDRAYTGAPFHLALWWSAAAPLPALTTQLALRPAAGGAALPWLTTAPVYGSYPFAAWSTPAFVIDHVGARLPDDVPGGDYLLELTVAGADGPVATATLGALTVEATARAFTLPPAAQSVDAGFADADGDVIALKGYTIRPNPPQFELELVWEARRTPQADYTVFVHALRPDGTCCAWQVDAMPRAFAYPTTRWVAGELVSDTYTVDLSGALPGVYPLEVGLYLAETGDRLRVGSADYVLLTPLTVP